MSAHLAFDVAAWLCTVAGGLAVYRWRLGETAARVAARLAPGYFAALLLGSVGGALLAGTLNLALIGAGGVGRSILGALLGGILAVEIWKARHGVRLSTGVVLAVPIALGIAVGRLGCHSAGLAELTYGVPAGAWPGIDFGDGVRRHPVQLYESGAMAAWTVVLLTGLACRSPFVLRHGFYWTMAFYGAQRFVLEFLKPYPSVLGPLNLFHVLSLILVVYALSMIGRDVSPAT